MEILLAILTIVWCILCIILFFKLWGMYNNVSTIKNILQKKYIDSISSEAEKLETQHTHSYEGTKVFAIYKPENMKVEILDKDDDDVYKCISIKDGQIYYFIKDVLEFL